MNWKVFLRKTAPRLLAAVVIVALLAVGATSLMRGRAGLIADLEGRLRRPFQQGAETIASWLEGLYGSVYGYDQLKAENETLREQLAEAQAEARAGQEALEENERLRQLLSFSQRHTDFDLESAKVVSYSASNWSAIITISKGDESGLEVGDSVITESGSLVGQAGDSAVLIADGRTRTMDRPKKKKIRHLRAGSGSIDWVRERILSRVSIYDHEIRKHLEPFQMPHKEG